jgi:hypothetical protein
MKRGLIIATVCMAIMAAPPVMAVGLAGFVVGYIKKQVTQRVTGAIQQKAMEKMAPGGMSGMMGMKMPAMSPEAMAAMQQSGLDLSDTTPLTGQEIDTLVRSMEKMAKQSPEQAGAFDPAEFKEMIAGQPQMAPMMRAMAKSMAQAEKSMEEARVAYTKMSPKEKDQVVQQLVAESKKMSPEERAALVTALQSDFFGMPEDLKMKAAAALK